VVAAAGTTTVVAGETTLNSLITGVIYGEITLSDSRVTIGIPLIIAILTGLGQSTARCPYPSFSNGVNLENFLFRTFVSIICFDVLVFNIIPEWVFCVLDL